MTSVESQLFGNAMTRPRFGFLTFFLVFLFSQFFSMHVMSRCVYMPAMFFGYMSEYDKNQYDIIANVIVSLWLFWYCFIWHWLFCHWLFWHWLFWHIGYYGIGYFDLGYFDFGYFVLPPCFSHHLCVSPG